MMRRAMMMPGFALALACASPLLAQMPPPADPPMGGANTGPAAGFAGRWAGRERPFASMSEAGRAVMQNAMHGADRKTEHDQVKAARDHMLAIVDADRLDTAALKRAMDDERRVATGSREAAQARMLDAITKLSPADRKAFVADARAMKARMESRMAEGRGRWGRGRPGGDMPPPQ